MPPRASETSVLKSASTAARDRARHKSQEAINDNSETARGGRVWHLPFAYRNVATVATIIDLVGIVFLGMLSSIAYNYVVFGSGTEILRSLSIALFVALTFVTITRLNGLYTPTKLVQWNIQLNNVIWIWSVTFFLLSGWLFVWKAGSDVSRGAILLFWNAGLFLLLLERLLWRAGFEWAIKSDALRGRRAIVVARDIPIDSKLSTDLKYCGYELLREFTVRGAGAIETDKDITRALAFVRGSKVEEVLLVVRDGDYSNLAGIIERLRILPLPVTWVADGAVSKIARLPWLELGSRMAVEMQKPPRNRPERALKRTVDILGAAVALLLLLPLLVFVALAIKFDSEGPILFWQTRRGFNGKPFKIAKFRSMSVLEDGAVIKQATKQDPRVTRVGAWIRKTSIDEIPQLINVFKGNMSLVGPRPHALVHDDQFIETVEHYAYRHHVKPGITGWAQVHGYRGETPTLEAIQRRVDLDRWYIDNWSIWLDVKIILRTFLAIIPGENAH